jgi:hypothetical protein
MPAARTAIEQRIAKRAHNVYAPMELPKMSSRKLKDLRQRTTLYSEMDDECTSSSVPRIEHKSPRKVQTYTFQSLVQTDGLQHCSRIGEGKHQHAGDVLELLPSFSCDMLPEGSFAVGQKG